jgi:WD40 repeat protein
MVLVSKWNKDGSLIASAGGEKSVKVWLPQAGLKGDQKVKVLSQENDIVDLDWQNSTDLASCALDSNIYLWSITQD